MRMRRMAVVLASGVLVGGMSGGPAAGAHEGGDFKLAGNFTDFDREDNGRPGWSEGDEISFTYDLFDRDGPAGTGDGLCTITELDRAEHAFAADCEASFDLDDGTLEMEGEVTGEDFHKGEITLDVVDGTGHLDDADGTATFRRFRGHGHKGGHDMGGHGDAGIRSVTAQPGHAQPGHDDDHPGGGHHPGHGDEGGHHKGDKEHKGDGHDFIVSVDLA